MQTMQAGNLIVVIDEATGGAIASFTAGGIEVLRPVADFRLEAEHGKAIAAYPLIPYANRVANGRFSFGGADFQLGLNFAGHPHSLHGNAWMRAWRVVSADPTQVHVALDHAPGDAPHGALAAQWPFAYHAEIIYELDEHGLSVEISLRNDDTRPFPAGIGLHPYVARDAGTLLQFDADTVWRNGADALPVAREAVSHHWDFAQAHVVGDAQIDECYAGWGGTAEVTWPATGLRMVMESGLPFDHLQLYTPPGRDFFGLEPVSNMPDAINRMDEVADNGLRILTPGDVLEGEIRFTFFVVA
jgi:aldose 1-epimerase